MGTDIPLINVFTRPLIGYLLATASRNDVGECSNSVRSKLAVAVAQPQLLVTEKKADSLLQLNCSNTISNEHVAFCLVIDVAFGYLKLVDRSEPLSRPSLNRGSCRVNDIIASKVSTRVLLTAISNTCLLIITDSGYRTPTPAKRKKRMQNQAF